MLTVKQETISLLTRDRLRLDADIYYPETTEALPILLMRQPYGRKIASTVVYAHPRWYAAQGYIVIIQDVRGRGTSQGEFKLFENEILDGLDTLNWLAQLPNSTGEVGMYGFSYQGMTQLYAAASQPPNLKTICPAMIAQDLYQDWAYENNAFCLQLNMAWAIQLAAETAKLRGDNDDFQKLYHASRHLPLTDNIPANPQILQELAPESFYHDWLNRPQSDPYWQNLSPQNLLENIDLPMLHIGGWFDPHLRGNLRLYQTLQNRCRSPQHLVVGPWGHLPWGQSLGEINYGEAANSFIDQMQIAWFDYFLKQKNSALMTNLPVKLFEMGSNQWRYYDNFTSGKQQIHYLHSNGLAAINNQAGKLVTTLPDVEIPVTDYFVHDPWRPVPSLGGHASFPAGVFERSLLDCRTDIVTYTSEPLTTDLHLLGSPMVEIQVQADSESFDLCAILSRMTADGNVYHISQGYRRLNQSQAVVNLSLRATCIKIPKGDRLRLSLSGACFPAYNVNAGTGKALAEAQLLEQQVITISIELGKHFNSKLCLSLNENIV